MVLAATALLEGLAIAANAHPMSVEGFGGMKASTVIVGGLQLAAISGATLFALWWSERPRREDIVDRLMAWLPLLAGVIIAIEGLTVASFAGTTVIRDVGSVNGLYVSAFGAQLFLLGAGLVTLRMFNSRGSVGLLVSLSSWLLLSSVGVLVVGIADRMTWAGMGGFKASTVLAIGLIIVVVGLVGLVVHYLRGWNILGRSLMGMELWTWVLLGLGVLVALAGAVVISLSGPVVIHGLTSFKESTVMLAGLMIFALGLLSFAPMALTGKSASRVRRMAVQAGLFAVLLLPFALAV